MTVHAILVLNSEAQVSNPEHVPTPEAPSLPTVVPDRVKQHVLGTFEEVAAEQAVAERHLSKDPLLNRPAHVKSVRRFNESEDKRALLDTIEQNVVADALWYGIYYHECEVDLPGSMATGCPEWTPERGRGTVPQEVRP